MLQLKSFLFKPLSALFLYIFYIISLNVLNTYIDKALGYAIMIWLGALFYLYLIFYSCKSISYASYNKITTVKAVINIAICALAGVIFFAVNYYYIYIISSSNFIGHIGSNPVSIFISFLYFSFATFATVGYGDISPISSLAKILAILEIIYSFFIIVIALSSFGQLKDGFKPLTKSKK